MSSIDEVSRILGQIDGKLQLLIKKQEEQDSRAQRIEDKHEAFAKTIAEMQAFINKSVGVIMVVAVCVPVVLEVILLNKLNQSTNSGSSVATVDEIRSFEILHN